MDERRAMGDMLELAEGRFFGKYRGKVQDHDDPTGRGRLQVLVPAVMGEEPVWAMPCTPYAGKNMGWYAMPEPGTGVWVEFEAGDPSFPIWVGCFWADDEVPETEQGNQADPPIKTLRTMTGLLLSLDDDRHVITLSDKGGATLVTLEEQQGTVTVKGAAKVVVEAPQIELVENATHPIVFGDRLLQYLNQLVSLYQSHTHPPLLSPPAPPMPPATPDLVSTRVKSG